MEAVMEVTSLKSRLIDLLKKTRSAQRAFWNTLTEEERSAPGKPDDWAPKDIMAHVNTWNDRTAARLEATACDEEPKQYPDFEDENRRIYEANKDKSWEDLLRFEESVFARLAVAIDALTEERLTDPKRFEWTNERPLWWNVAFTCYYHGMAHIADILFKRGDHEVGFALHKHLADDLLSLDDGDTWQGTTLYNLACIYSLHNSTEKAIDLLRRSFELNPDLLDWSKKDSDLDRLRELPAFKSLYEAIG
jgi:tetratricopeptide (TPR) repeat protein